MLETVINDVAGIFRSTFLNGDMIALTIAFGSVVVASLVMRRGTQIGSMTLLALILFAIGGYLRGYFRGAAAETTYGHLAGLFHRLHVLDPSSVRRANPVRPGLTGAISGRRAGCS